MATKLVIKVNGFGQGTVELDGTDISTSVRAVEFRAEAGHETTVNLELSVTEIETSYLGSAEREILVNMPDEVVNTLLVLGWNPPQNDNRTYRLPVTEWVPADEFHTPSAEEWDIRDLPEGCRCFELDHHRQYFTDGTHHEQCPLFIIDNASPDAND